MGDMNSYVKPMIVLLVWLVCAFVFVACDDDSESQSFEARAVEAMHQKGRDLGRTLAKDSNYQFDDFIKQHVDPGSSQTYRALAYASEANKALAMQIMQDVENGVHERVVTYEGQQYKYTISFVNEYKYEVHPYVFDNEISEYIQFTTIIIHLQSDGIFRITDM